MNKPAHTLEIYLKPGEYFVGDASHRVRTLLGSCVSVTLWHPKARTGAMCHFLLPDRGKPWPAEPDSRYGDEAIWLMLRDLSKRQVMPQQCEARIFGGGDMFPHLRDTGQPKVGNRNGATARALLAKHEIPVLSECLFGVGHRSIIFEIATGRVWSRQTTPDPPRPISGARHKNR